MGDAPKIVILIEKMMISQWIEYYIFKPPHFRGIILILTPP